MHHEKHLMHLERLNDALFEEDEEELQLGVSHKKNKHGAEKQHVPGPEFSEFLLDLSNVLTLHKTTLFTKISEFYAGKVLKI